MTIQRLIVTSGEPAGIGPDLCVQFAQLDHACELIVIADPNLLKQRAQLLGIELTMHLYQPDCPRFCSRKNHVQVLPARLAQSAIPGQLNPSNSRYVLETIALAIRQCQLGNCDGMVTAPVHKGIINDAGIAFSGHTEYIADITRGSPVMMLATKGLRVALATTHLPLAKVSQAITQKSLHQIINILHQDLQKFFGLTKPRILVCGLNPHAGEGGHLGDEEIEVIEPVIGQLQAQGMKIQGPLPADTLFTEKHLQQADAILAMYHDQGLPVLKHMGFGKAVNITLGLPIIRTSVDHGTALDLAATGKADLGSMLYAIETAQEMAKLRC